MSSRRYGPGGIFLVLKMGKSGKMERGVEARTARGLITVGGFGSEEGDPYHPTQSNSVTPASGVSRLERHARTSRSSLFASEHSAQV